MKTITTEEILALYKKCDLDSSSNFAIRTMINTGNLSNQLNTNYEFFNKNIMQINNAIPRRNNQE